MVITVRVTVVISPLGCYYTLARGILVILPYHSDINMC